MSGTEIKDSVKVTEKSQRLHQVFLSEILGYILNGFRTL